MKKVTLFAIVCWLALVRATQAQVLTGNVIGTVKDESGAVLPGVTVTLASPALPSGQSTVVTTERGEYRFTQLDPGSYGFTVTLAGFSTYQEQGLQVAVGGTIERDVVLKVAAVAETITVSGATPMVDPRRVGVTANVPQVIIQELPSRRNVMSVYLKWSSPGVAPSDPSGYNANVSVMGSATGENSILFDGVMTNNPGDGSYGPGGDLTSAEEIQVITLGASAEYQVAQGAVFNVVMKGGTNLWRFDATDYWYPDGLESKPIKVACNCSLGQTGYTKVLVREPSGHAGGPIVKDRLWVFGGGIWSDRAEANPGIDPRLPRLQYNRAILGKGTAQVTGRLKVSGTLNRNWFNNPGLPTLSRPFETILTGNIGYSNVYASELDYTISNSTLLTARVTGYNMPDRWAQPLTGDFVTSYHVDSVSGIACCGVQSFGNTPLGRHGQAVKVDRYIQGARVEHSLGVGVQVEEANANSFGAFPSGVWYSDAAGKPDQATFRAPYTSGALSRSQGIWAQDQISVGNRLTVSVGVRFDRMHAISPDEPVVDNLAHPTAETIKGLGDMFTWNVAAPRLGFNLKVTGDSKTILRGNYGRAYRTIFLSDFTTVHPGLSPITLTRYNPATGGYTTIISVTDPTANVAVDPALKAPYTDQYSLGIDRELLRNMGLGLTYVHKYGAENVGWHDIGGVYGTQTAVLPDGRTVTVYPLLNATGARKFLRTNGPGTFTRYNGLVMTFEKRMSQQWQVNLSYTYSKAEGLTTTQQDPNGDVNSGGLLSTDRPHMLVGGGSYEIPRIAVQLSARIMALSGGPFAPQAQVSLPQGRTTVNIATTDGTYRYPGEDLLYLRFNKILFRHQNRRLELGAEIANALQSKAFDSVVTQNYYSSTFAQPASWIEPRRMYFLAKVLF